MRSPFPTPSLAADYLAAGTMLARKLAHHLTLSASERDALDALLGRSVRHLRHRALLVDAGAAPNEIHILIEGWACRFAALPNGRRQIVALYLPGDVCDFDVFLMKRMDQSIAAIGPARVAAVSRATLNEISRSQPRIAQGLWWESMVTAAIQRAWTVNVGTRPARERLAHLLCEIHARLSLVGLADDGGISLPLTQADLGDACAMTAIHTNRALQSLRADHLVSLTDNCLTITPALTAIADFDPGYLQVKSLVDTVEQIAPTLDAALLSK